MKKRTLLLLAALSFTVCCNYAATVKQLNIKSKKMGKNVPAILILPDAYQQNDDRFPVLYLLHGAGGNFMSWARSPIPAQLADQYGFIIVCPDGGVTSWYIDSPVDPTFQYETFVAKECVKFVDKHFRTLSDRQHRATCGFSMGGYGALYLAIRNPKTFSIACSISGGVDVRPFPKHWELSKRLGDIETHPENWEAHTVINLAQNLKNGVLAISFECGTEDFFNSVNKALHQQLLADGIKHVYAEHPGAHTGPYSLAALQRQAVFIDEQFKKSEAGK